MLFSVLSLLLLEKYLIQKDILFSVISLHEYFTETKKKLEESIPPLDSVDFKKMRDRIRSQLKKKENQFKWLLRSLKVLVLGDWHTPMQRKTLSEIKNMLLINGIYTQTIGDYYDMDKKGGLNQIQILETCCINHQLIVFIDGQGSGTVTEQNYLSDNYPFQGKVVFFIEDGKFDKLKGDPTEYVRIFPTIIIHSLSDLLEKVLVFTRFRLYRLAEIIMKQTATGRGLKNPDYRPWKKRLRQTRK